MFLELFNNLVIPASTTLYSASFDIGADNALFIEAYISVATALNIKATVEGSNDNANWVPDYGTGTVEELTGSGPFTLGGNMTGLAARFLRVAVANGASTSSATVTLSVNSKHL